jgi:hypothetical protein
MAYLYTNNNLLENPISYMYSKFEGPEFFNDYFKDRLKFSNRISQNNNSSYEFKVDAYLSMQLFKELKDLSPSNYDELYKLSKYKSLDNLAVFDNDVTESKSLNLLSIESGIDIESLLTLLIYTLSKKKNKELKKIIIALSKTFQFKKNYL